MFDIPSVRVGRVFGIPIEINLSWIVVFGLVGYSLGASYFPQIPAAQEDSAWLVYAVGFVTALLFFASIVAHELSHSLVARAEGSRVDSITLFIFGGVAQIDEEPRTPLRELLMAAAGPAMSLALAGAALLGFVLTAAAGSPWWIWAPLEYLAAINFAVAVFNLLPGFPLDGGRVLRSVLWASTGDLRRATRWASRVGQAMGWAMVVIAVAGVAQGNTGLIWFGLVGWFIASLAGASYRQQAVLTAVDGLVAADVMTARPEHVDGLQTLEELVDTHVLGRRHSRYPVMLDGSVVGLVTLPGVKAVERGRWDTTRVIDVADRDLAALVVDVDDPVESFLVRLAGDRPGALIVAREGRMVGLITRSDVIGEVTAR